MTTEKPPRVGLGVIKRAAVAAVLIVFATAGAVSATVILDVKQIQREIIGDGKQLVDIPEVTTVDPGRARTIMVLGSDARYRDRRDEPPRSDTILLVRVNPKKDVISVLSIPRDLQVQIPGRGFDKINAAYELGGPRLTVRTVKELLSTPGDPFEVNNVVIVNFGGFQRAVNYIDGVYVDVDRRYFNDRTGPGGYAAIDLQPGYQKLVGSDALSFVRYRHQDNDFVRAARQQAFLRAIKTQPGVRELLDFRRRHELAKLFRRYIEVDRSLRSTKQVFSLLKLAIYAGLDIEGVRQVKFRAGESDHPRPAQRRGDAEHRDRFARADREDRARVLPGRATAASAGSPVRRVSTRRSARRGRPPVFAFGAVRGLQDGAAAGRAVAAGRGRSASRSTSPASSRPAPPTAPPSVSGPTACAARAGACTAPTGSWSRSVRPGSTPACRARPGAIPPILADPDATRTIRGRKLRLYSDGRRLRMVMWRTPRAVYWISNSLSNTLSSNEMLAMAASLERP